MSGFAAMLIKVAGWLDMAFAGLQLAWWFGFARRRLSFEAGPRLLRMLDAVHVQIAVIFLGTGIVLLRFSGDLASLRVGREILLVFAAVWAIGALFPLRGGRGQAAPEAGEAYIGQDSVWPGRILGGVFTLGALIHILPVVLG